MLRGINVGGARKVAMPELRLLAESLGYQQVSTYINSGNLLLSSRQRAAEVVAELERGIHHQYGFAVPVIVRTDARLRAVLAANPYPEGNPSQVMVAFLAGKPGTDAEQQLAPLATDEERFTLGKTEAYIDFAGGLAHSRLAAHLGKAIGTEVTTRNIRTVGKLIGLLDT